MIAWRSWGRVLCAAGVASIAGVQSIAGARGERPMTAFALLLLGALAALYGAGAKLADLTAEHGLRARPFRLMAHGMMALGLVAMAPFSAGATLIMTQLVFHGVIKGKADNRAHVAGGAFVISLLVAAFWFLPAGRVDWWTVAIVASGSSVWMWMNNRWLRLGDNLFHQVRGDMIVTFGALALVDRARWLPFAVAIASEHLAYALTKRVAMTSSWYRAGDDAVPSDPDPFGVAFHAGKERDVQ
jgi:hypothetical protein